MPATTARRDRARLMIVLPVSSFAGQVLASHAPRYQSLFPCREGFVEDTLAGGAFFQGDYGAAVVVVDDRNVEPTALLEQLQVALPVALHTRQADEKEAAGDLDREAGE